MLRRFFSDFALVFEIQSDALRCFEITNRGKGRDRMFVDHLLLAVGHQHYHKAVKAGDSTPELETIHQEKCYGHFVLFHFT